MKFWNSSETERRSPKFSFKAKYKSIMLPEDKNHLIPGTSHQDPIIIFHDAHLRESTSFTLKSITAKCLHFFLFWLLYYTLNDVNVVWRSHPRPCRKTKSTKCRCSMWLEMLTSISPQVQQSKLQWSSHKALYDNTSKGNCGYRGLRGNVFLPRRLIDCFATNSGPALCKWASWVYVNRCELVGVAVPSCHFLTHSSRHTSDNKNVSRNRRWAFLLIEERVVVSLYSCKTL